MRILISSRSFLIPNLAVNEDSDILNVIKDSENFKESEKPIDLENSNQKTSSITTKSWISLFSDNRKMGNDLELNYVPSESKDSVIFDDDEWNEGAKIWQFSLIGQVLGMNIRFKAMESFIKKVWKHSPEICLLRAGIFLFKFKSKNDMNDVISNGPWFFGSRPLLLKPWAVNEEIYKSDDCIYPLWIQLPELKLNLWNSKCISKIASIIGKPVATDKLTATKQRLTYARVLVEVKMPTVLPDQITVQGPNGKSYNQKIHYEFKPRWCDLCKVVRHDANYCKKISRVQKWIPKQKVFPGDIGNSAGGNTNGGSVGMVQVP
ncbi:uncharacterized protein LOC109829738 [Asparagus officinalis]|uniref:uncharacterized protein LOC109829738 n=1 Tax=Asparagus officinalis TaxID=4686 RepID=UPI00098E79FA|nr:uncharacterized protein LOC109829738 [Asparagus officinalis]